MKFKATLLFLVYTIIVLTAGLAVSQESLQASLQEESDYYNNYANKGFAKKTIEKQKIPYFDKFGSHVVNGYLIYGLQSNRNNVFDTDDKGFQEATDSAYNDMFQTSIMSDNFNNVVLAQDALGDMKSLFIVGSQIQTRLTPLTMNKLNFQGFRWDIWTGSLKFTSMLSRTRPFVMAQNDVSGRSYIGYDRADMRNWQGVKTGDLLPDEEYISRTWASGEGAFVNRRDGWVLQYDKWADFSNKSVYGDYDILWGFHGKTNIANVADVGVTYLNHHRSDIKKGEKIFTGDLPDEYAPEEIHFEVYDLTPERTTDLGAKVHAFEVIINGFHFSDKAKFYTVAENRQLVSSSMGYEVSGHRPLVVVFNIKDIASKDSRIGDLKRVKQVDFNFVVSGNYLVFVSTDKLVSYGFSAQRSTGGNVDVDGAFVRKVEDMTSTQLEALTENTGSKPIGGPHSGSGLYYTSYSNSWFGDYIAKSPKLLYVDGSVGDTMRAKFYDTSKRKYSYSYSINNASVTYGVDFKGKLLGVKFDGELAVNKKDYKYPGGNDIESSYRVASYLRFSKDIVPNILALQGMLYNVAPEYDPGMDIPEVSRHFSYSRLYTKYITSGDEDFGIPDYLFYPQHFNNNFRMLDDNDDEDLYVESDRIVYPSDLGTGNAVSRWAADGTFASYKASERENSTLNRKANYTRMPNGIYTFYGDDDGVYVDRHDRNRNGVPDYKEDFLLYSSDPPIFTLDNDVDNNGVWDIEDDDLYPDLPNGIKVSYVLTGNGFKSQGVRGGNLKLVYSPVKNLDVSASVLYEKALDLDINKSNDEYDDGALLGNGTINYEPSINQSNSREESFADSRNLGIKTSVMLNVIKRSIGLEYFVGAEVQYLRDNIRNDVMRLQEIEEIEYLYKDYYYQTDELRFRNAALSNLIAGITYNNVPNLTWSSRLAVGGIKRFSLDGKFYTVRTLRSSLEDTTYYHFNWEPYESSVSGKLYFVNKFDYTFKFKLEGNGMKGRLFSIINRLSINPQYKFAWSYMTGDAVTDPRGSELPAYTEDNIRDKRLEWSRYRAENENLISSVPILRASFIIAERTQLEYGVQWKRDYDYLVKEESNRRTVQTIQISARDKYNGYNVALMLGMNFINKDYDVLDYNSLYQTGHLYDSKSTRFFINVYAGN